jgi:hypothetical protein
LLIFSVTLPCLTRMVLTLKRSLVLLALSFFVVAAGRFGVAPLAAWLAAVPATAAAVTATAATIFLERKSIPPFTLRTGCDGLRRSARAGSFYSTRRAQANSSRRHGSSSELT